MSRWQSGYFEKMTPGTYLLRVAVTILGVGAIAIGLKFASYVQTYDCRVVAGTVQWVSYSSAGFSDVRFTSGESIRLAGNLLGIARPSEDCTVVQSEGWWFPAWPNILDCAILVFAGLSLLALNFREALL